VGAATLEQRNGRAWLVFESVDVAGGQVAAAAPRPNIAPYVVARPWGCSTGTATAPLGRRRQPRFRTDGSDGGWFGVIYPRRRCPDPVPQPDVVSRRTRRIVAA
jgi:hypothetical protein